jgi:hypothetical protein
MCWGFHILREIRKNADVPLVLHRFNRKVAERLEE